MLLYIVRHGETDLNSKGVLQGHIDVPLNASGIFLAEETGRNMRGIHFDRCISSPLIRARKTVELILKESGNGDVPIETEERIMEINGGVYEGRKLSEGPIPNGEARRFFTDPVHFAGFPGGETYDDVKKRTQDFLKDMCAISDDKTYLIGIHGCAVRGMLNCFYENQEDYWQGHVPYNCAINIVEIRDGKAELIDRDKIYYDESYIVDCYASPDEDKKQD